MTTTTGRPIAVVLASVALLVVAGGCASSHRGAAGTPTTPVRVYLRALDNLGPPKVPLLEDPASIERRCFRLRSDDQKEGCLKSALQHHFGRTRGAAPGYVRACDQLAPAAAHEMGELSIGVGLNSLLLLDAAAGSDRFPPPCTTALRAMTVIGATVAAQWAVMSVRSTARFNIHVAPRIEVVSRHGDRATVRVDDSRITADVISRDGRWLIATLHDPYGLTR